MEPYHGVVKLKNIEDLVEAVVYSAGGPTYILKDGELVLLDTKK